MKKNIILLGALVISGLAYSQVGIDTDTPKATLDIKASPASPTKIDGLIAPRLKGSELQTNNSKYTADQDGAIVYVTEALTTTDDKTINVTSIGYFYFDKTVGTAGRWMKVANPVAAVAYQEPWNVSGTTNPATLNTQNIYQMGRVGIGTDTPGKRLHVNSSTHGANEIPVLITTPDMAIDDQTYIKIGKADNGSANLADIKYNYQGETVKNYLGFGFSGQGTSAALTGAGNFGINTTTPVTRLQVNGSVRGGVSPQGTIGNNSAAFGDNNTASGAWSFAYGGSTKATNSGALAGGYNTTADGQNSIAVGNGAKALAVNSVAFGLGSEASGQHSFAANNNSKATGLNSAAFNYSNTASNENSTAFGQGNTASGKYSLVWGLQTQATNDGASAGGYNTIASGQNSFVMGSDTQAIGTNSVAFGLTTKARGNQSIAIGYRSETAASATSAIAIGSDTKANAADAVAFGNGSIANGQGSFAAGIGTTTATGSGSFAGGNGAKAVGNNSIALGHGVEASGTDAAAFGLNTIAGASYSFTQGYGSNATNESEAVLGQWNLPVTGSIFQVGNGNGTGSKSNLIVGIKGGVPGDSWIAIGSGNNTSLSRVGTEKLRVYGTIQTVGDFYPDYVFEDYFNGTSTLNSDYKFKSIYDTEKFIKENKHLPGVTSVKELDKTENGYSFNLTDLSTQTLEKVEELYLHTIEQQKQIDELKEVVKAQQKQINKLMLK